MANFFLFGLYFGENKAHFFPEHSKTKSIAHSVYTHYFSKAPARTGKGGKRRMEGAKGCMHLLQHRERHNRLAKLWFYR